ncbi:MAG: amidase family protein [Actinomycetota bacterium]|nr:amidase family protein [Actinomycetota bacterium]
MTTSGPPGDLTSWPAHRLAAAMRDARLTVTDVVTAFAERADALEPTYHALVSRRPPDEVVAEAARLDARPAAGRSGALFGLPLAVKDLTDVRGLPTTLGFWRPDEVAPASADADFVPALRAAGAVIVAKTNTPEFGLGSHTYSEVAPTTRNAFDPRLSAGGSSGGAAVAVATGMVPVADGSDFMGSLRNPTGWNGVFGLRPSGPLRPESRPTDVRADGGVAGPVARDATDLALMLAAMSGTPARTGDGGFPRRVGWLGDLAGYLPTEERLLPTCRSGLAVFGALGADVEEAVLPVTPDFDDISRLWPTWTTFRHAAVGAELAEFAAQRGVLERMKPEARFEVEGYLALSDADRQDMARRRAGLARSFAVLFDTYDVVVLPTAQVFPFSAELHWPSEIAGATMDTYHRWMEVTAPATLAGLPVLAVPVPTAGLPIGLQVIGPPLSEPMLLDVAAQWQRTTAGADGVALCRGAPV